MCGIAGYVVLRGGRTPSQKSLRIMNAMLTHRGPDEDGFFAGPHVGFAMRRLAIVDIDGGKQPCFSPGREVMTVFNGEIYNYPELRALLAGRGVFPPGEGDTEIIPAMFLEFGPDMVKHFNGMFAIAVWDFREKQCYLFRDRFGQKPLYTTVHRKVFYFASEIKPLLSLPFFPRRMDLDAMRQYLYLGQLFGPRTSFAGISSLAPGHWRAVSRNVLAPPRQYWDIAIPEKRGAVEFSSIERHRDEFHEKLKLSTSLRLRSDVPVAATLSGGIDSSAILCYASELADQPSEAFSITFSGENSDTNEKKFQDAVIARLKVNSHRFDFSEQRNRIVDSLHDAYWTYEMPDSVVQQEVLFKFLTRKMNHAGFKVGLGGEGADEMMRGYEWYAPGESARRRARTRLSEQERRILESENWFLDRWGFPSHIYGDSLLWKPVQQLFDRGELPPAFADESRGGPAYSDFSTHVPTERFRALDGEHLLQYSDIKLRLPEFILSVQDRFSMASSVEMRSPFLDHHLAEWLVNLPEGLHWGRSREKFLLRRLMDGRLPRSVVRRRKQGYHAPFIQGRDLSTRALVKNALSTSSIKKEGIFQPEFVKALKNASRRHRSRRGAARPPRRWIGVGDSGLSTAELFLDRTADIQIFARLFRTRID